jgi:hypothetical protein
MDGVLHHYNRAVHNHAEVNCAQAHQVGADAEKPHAEKANQHGKGNDLAVEYLIREDPNNSVNELVTVAHRHPFSSHATEGT